MLSSRKSFFGIFRSLLCTAGQSAASDPRYCPSIEDKILKFPDAKQHQIFLEPEGLDTAEMYVNGLSTSLPPDVQLQFLHSVAGLESAVMTRPGYAIEYDYFPPTQLEPTLESKQLAGCSWPGKSTALRATRKPQDRELLPASTQLPDP